MYKRQPDKSLLTAFYRETVQKRRRYISVSEAVIDVAKTAYRGIAPAIMVGYIMQLPVVFVKKKKPKTMENMLSTCLLYTSCMCMVMALLPNVTMTAFAATSGTVTGLSLIHI